INQRELFATGSHAEYDVVEGRVVLSGNPRVVRGRDILQGEKITFWRDSSRILSEPNARLVIYSDRDILTGATSVSDK
ncbi:MAG: LptA/OstA family protein, partial [Kiritimatiellia bacterium]